MMVVAEILVSFNAPLVLTTSPLKQNQCCYLCSHGSLGRCTLEQTVWQTSTGCAYSYGSGQRLASFSTLGTFFLLSARLVGLDTVRSAQQLTPFGCF